MGTATDKQAGFIRSLLAEREVGTEGETILVALNSGAMDSKSASNVITKLLSSPRKQQAQTQGNVRVSPWDAATQALADVESSFYGIPAGYLAAESIDLYGNDYLFVVIRPFKGKKYLSRVHGAPGRPNYSKFSPAQCVALANIMRGRHVEFAENWHKHSGRCGKCNAVLTDLESRERGLGPVCASSFGV